MVVNIEITCIRWHKVLLLVLLLLLLLLLLFEKNFWA